MKTPLTKAKIKHHFAYGSWKYLIVIVAAIFGWNLLYTVTAYRPPAEKIVDFYIAWMGADSQALELYMEEARQAVLPEMEQMQAVTLMSGSEEDDYYGNMQLSTYIFAGEGDVYLLAKQDFRSYASNGAMVPLDPYMESGALTFPESFALNKGYVTFADADLGINEKHLYGIPAANLPGLKERFNIPVDDMYLCVLHSGGNVDNCVTFLQYMVDTLQ